MYDINNLPHPIFCSGARALRNLSVNSANKMAITRLGAITHLRALTEVPNERISQQGGYFASHSIVTQTLNLTRTQSSQ